MTEYLARRFQSRDVLESSVRSGMSIGTQPYKAPLKLRQERHVSALDRAALTCRSSRSLAPRMPLDYKHGAPDGAWPRRRLDYRLRLMHKSHSFSRRISGGQQPVLTHQSINPSIRLQLGSGCAGL